MLKHFDQCRCKEVWGRGLINETKSQRRDPLTSREDNEWYQKMTRKRQVTFLPLSQKEKSQRAMMSVEEVMG